MTAGSLSPISVEMSLSSRGKEVKRWATCPHCDFGKSGDPVKWYHTTKEEKQAWEGGRKEQQRGVGIEWVVLPLPLCVSRLVVQHLSDTHSQIAVCVPARCVCVLSHARQVSCLCGGGGERRNGSQIRSTPFTSPSAASSETSISRTYQSQSSVLGRQRDTGHNDNTHSSDNCTVRIWDVSSLNVCRK